MTITIAGIDFDYQDYDERGDVLFLHVGKPVEPPAKAFETAAILNFIESRHLAYQALA